MGRVSTCQKNCKTIDLCGAQVKNSAHIGLECPLYIGVNKVVIDCDQIQKEVLETTADLLRFQRVYTL